MKQLLRGCIYGAAAGWSVGAAESALVATITDLAFASPISESVGVALHYSLVGGFLGALLALLSKLTHPAHFAGAVGGLMFLATGLSWIHQDFYAGIPLFALEPLIASAVWTVACSMAGFSMAQAPHPILPLFLTALAGHLCTALTSAPITPRPQEVAKEVVAKDGAPNILFILVDTLRADHMSSYGYPIQTSPEMDKLASQGIRFDSAWAQATWTRPSVASLMTSLYPASHQTNFLDTRIPESFTTLAETIHSAGYQTAGFSANRNVESFFGFGQGFDSFWPSDLGSVRANAMLRFTTWERAKDILARGFGVKIKTMNDFENHAAALNNEVFAWFDDKNSNKPWFLYIQYIDPHFPYQPPSDFLEGTDIEPISVELQNQVAGAIGSVSKVAPYPFASQDALPEDIKAQVIRLYDAEIQYCDREIGRLLETLRKRGVMENTFVVITSDHGEEFWEHQQYNHGHSTFSEVARVPLIITGPGIEPGVRAQSVELIDLYPTLATWASSPLPQNIHGSDLSPVLAGNDGLGRAFTQNMKSDILTSLTLGKEKLVQVEYRGEEVWMLFDLSIDPGETNNLAESRPERVAELRELLEQRRVESASFQPAQAERVQLDGQRKAELENLGYGGEEDEE